MSHEFHGRITVERDGSTVIAKIDGGTLATFGPHLAEQVEELVDRADGDPTVAAMVFTGTHPQRFISHAEVEWLQEGGASAPPLGRRRAAVVERIARSAADARSLDPLTRRTPLWGAVQLDRLHKTFLRMNSSGVVFVAALNGSALGVGAELAWACDLRVMADGDFVIGQPEVLFGVHAGAGGTQRLTRLIGTHRSLLANLEGTPFTPAQALECGAIDDVVDPAQLLATATTLAQHYGSRSKGAIAAIKRAVYVGGSADLARGLEIERMEFLQAIQSADGQRLMKDYIAATEASGELPLFKGDTYARALDDGTVSAGPRPPR